MRVVDLLRREEGVHPEGPRLVRDDRHDPVAEALLPHEVLEQTHPGHRRGDLLLARALGHLRVLVVARQLWRRVVDPPRGQPAAELAAALAHVPDRLVVLAGVVVGRQVGIGLELLVGDRDLQPVAQPLEVVEGELLHLVGRIAPGEVRAQAVALDRLGEDDRRLTGVVHRGAVGGVDLVVVVATALELPPHVGVGPVLDELAGARVAVEEVLPHVGAVVGAEGLVVAVGRLVHEVDQGAVAVGGEQRVPAATPDDLDDIPPGTAELRLELLDDLAVAAHRPVEALEVAVDDEGEVVELLEGGCLQQAAALRLVHLAVAEEGPHVLLRGVLDAAVVQVLVELSLVDRVHRTDAHRHRGELPELGHQARVGVGGHPGLALPGEPSGLLTEAVHLLLAEAALEEGPGVHAGGGVALEEDLVAATRVVLAPPEVVEADLVEGRRGGVGRDVPAHADAGALGAVDLDRGIPADPRAVAALDLFVTRVPRLVRRSDGVDVVGRRQRRDPDVLHARTLEQAQHDVAGPLAARVVDQRVDGVQPLGRLLRVDVRQVGGDAVEDGAVAEVIC